MVVGTTQLSVMVKVVSLDTVIAVGLQTSLQTVTVITVEAGQKVVKPVTVTSVVMVVTLAKEAKAEAVKADKVARVENCIVASVKNR